MKLFRTISVVLAAGGFSLASTAPAHAQADTQYIGQVSAFAGNYCPRNWGAADGTLLAISANTALFSLLGTTYGGNGTTTFALSDLRGRRPVGFGDSPGIGTYAMGQSSGTTQFTLTNNNLPTPEVSSSRRAYRRSRLRHQSNSAVTESVWYSPHWSPFERRQGDPAFDRTSHVRSRAGDPS